MIRFAIPVACAILAVSCCGEGERIGVAPLPQDGTALPYSQVVARLSAQTKTAKEEHFMNRWDGIVDASVALEQSANYLLRSPDLPPTHKAAIEKTSGEIKSDILKLREAARKKDQSESLELIRRLHNEVRGLQDYK